MNEKNNSQDFNVARAEIFDAISHPMRIKILQALSERQVGFAELKRMVGIESSGHLDFHLTKLKHFVKTTPKGAYVLTDDGREALWSVSSLRRSENGADSISHTPGNTGRYRALIAISLVAVILTGSVALYQQQVAVSQAATASSLQGQVSALSRLRDNLIANITALLQERTFLELALFQSNHVSHDQQNQLVFLDAQISTLESQLAAQNPTSFRTFYSNFTTNRSGEVSLTGNMKESGYNGVRVWINQWPTRVSGLTVQVMMGRDGSVPSSVIDTFSLGEPSFLARTVTLHNYNLAGPDLAILLTGGPPNTLVGIQALVYFY
jgi:DNA-binding transcriptional ArsR family regulator